MYFTPLTSNSPLLQQVKDIYMQSFPAAERRPWDKVIELMDKSSSPYSFYAINSEANNALGMISIWTLPDCIYIEHFAIDKSYRNNGLGSQVLDILKKIAQGRPILLEVEPKSEGEMAIRRQAFYGRNGFLAHPDFSYFQPPYSLELPSVPLTLMTYGQLNLSDAAQNLHSIVYGFSQ